MPYAARKALGVKGHGAPGRHDTDLADREADLDGVTAWVPVPQAKANAPTMMMPTTATVDRTLLMGVKVTLTLQDCQGYLYKQALS